MARIELPNVANTNAAYSGAQVGPPDPYLWPYNQDQAQLWYYFGTSPISWLPTVTVLPELGPLIVEATLTFPDDYYLPDVFQPLGQGLGGRHRSSLLCFVEAQLYSYPESGPSVDHGWMEVDGHRDTLSVVSGGQVGDDGVPWTVDEMSFLQDPVRVVANMSYPTPDPRAGWYNELDLYFRMYWGTEDGFDGRRWFWDNQAPTPNMDVHVYVDAPGGVAGELAAGKAQKGTVRMKR